MNTSFTDTNSLSEALYGHFRRGHSIYDYSIARECSIIHGGGASSAQVTWPVTCLSAVNKIITV